MKTKQYVDGELYAFMTYLHTKKSLEAGSIFVKDSINYRSLDDELIPIKTWKEKKDSILRKINNPLLLTPIDKILLDINSQLESKYQKVNRRIKSKENKDITIDTKKNKITWKLPYKKQEDQVNNPFYEKLPTNNISDVIRIVAEKTDFLKYFTHIQPNSSKTRAELDSIIAYMISRGSGIGKSRMKDISDITLSELDTTENNFIRLETLRKSNDQIVNCMAKLPIFKYYNLSDYGIHVSLDGQKIESKYLTIKARNSSKYFGRSKGVVSYTLVANHVPINTMIIGANEHESNYVFDIVYNNTTDIVISAVSSDMHGINRVNFFLLYMFGYWFTPRLTSINEKAEKNLAKFSNLDKYKNFLIKPSIQVDQEAIKVEWDNVLRILASLALKETSQSIIVKKLSSYKSVDSTLKAMIDLDKLIMSSYILDYIDDGNLRSIVHRALNRGESFHQIRSAILQISGRKLAGRNDIELEISNECNRFLANCIIYFNAYILSDLLKIYESKKQTKICELIKRLSPVAWQHINMVGKFEFFTNQQKIDFSNLTEELVKQLGENFSFTKL
jgi:TnpA family transposase